MAIASCLIDTNILLRAATHSDPQHKLINDALTKLASDATALHYTHQNIAELWNVMTRPVSRNGFGLMQYFYSCESSGMSSGQRRDPCSTRKIRTIFPSMR
jgi:hypothetical protein